MKRKKNLFVAVMIMLLMMSGCRSKTEEVVANEETSPFQFEVSDVYGLLDGGVVVTGYVQSGIMHVEDDAWLVKEDGTKIETRVVQMEVYDIQKEDTVLTDEIGEDSPVGVLLENLEKDQVDVGDLLVEME